MWIALASTISLLPAETLPSQLLDLSSWKLTLPTPGKNENSPREIKQPALQKFSDPLHFHVDPKARAVVFRAPCGGTTTKGSSYPRSELREMSRKGDARASWGTNDGFVHTMTLRVAITHTPKIKKHVVCAQIHDSGDDLMMIRLEGTHLFIERKPHEDVTLVRDYVLGTPFDVKIEASGSRVKVWHDGKKKMDWEVAREGCYFKAGCYTQSNPDKGDAADSYGEVAIHRLDILHTPAPTVEE